MVLLPQNAAGSTHENSVLVQRVRSKISSVRAAASWRRWQRGVRSCAEPRAAVACRYNDDLARKRNDAEHEKQRARQRELVGLQEESARRQEAERRRVAEQIEAERRATEKYKARLELGVRLVSSGAAAVTCRSMGSNFPSKAVRCRRKACCTVDTCHGPVEGHEH